MFSSAKHPVLTGTAILTCAGIVSRLIGFFYRIFLSRTIGAQGLGIYQMIFPVYAFCLSGVAAGIQSALSRCCAAALSQGNPRKGWAFFLSGTTLSVGLSLIVSFFLYTHASWISLHILQEIRCCKLLQLLAFSLPLCSIHTCIHAWYFATRRTTIPAVSQLLEQFARVGASYIIYLIFLEHSRTPTPVLAVGGMLFGELVACIFCIVCLAFQKPSHKGNSDFRIRSCLSEILTLSVPLTLNRMLVNLLQSTEAILMPGKLEASGLSNSQSLSLYGALTGMALPFILFPSAITSALSTMLLPTIAGQQAAGKESAIIRSTERTIQYCLWLGFLSGGIFFFFGKELANLFYQNQDAGIFLQILAFLCPFLYLTATLTGILNGLGHTAQCLIQNLAGLGIRILFVYFAIPRLGIRGYLFGLLLSQLVITGLNLLFLHKNVKFRFPATKWIILPCCGMILGCGCGLFLYRILSEMKMNGYITLFGGVLVAGGVFLLAMRLCSKKSTN